MVRNSDAKVTREIEGALKGIPDIFRKLVFHFFNTFGKQLGRRLIYAYIKIFTVENPLHFLIVTSPLVIIPEPLAAWICHSVGTFYRLYQR
jgi:hypothetical protein